ncbi:MAG: putative sulfatase [Verrucomicrobia bacterium]|nr:MAG: putative sulfatase [Verrucomicrobiota bacterium]
MKIFLKAALLWGLLLVTACGAVAARPNILWITSEDNGPHLGCYGEPLAVTPYLDGLAARGMRYTHAISNAPVCAPARTTVITGLYAPSAGAEPMRSAVSLPAEFRLFPQLLREAGYYCTNNAKEDYNLTNPGPLWDESSGKAHWNRRAPGQPFFAVFNSEISHESQIRNQIGQADRIHDPAKVRVPAYHPDTPEVRQDWAQYHDRITMMDAQCGQRLRELAEAGLEEETIVFYWADHGSGMPRNKRWPYHSGLSVPLIVSFPEKWKHLAPKDYVQGGESGRMVAFVDFAPTLLSLVGIAPPGWMQGEAFAGPHQTEGRSFNFGYRGRMDERFDCVRSVMGSRYVYIRNYMPHKIYGQYIAYMFQTPTTRVWQELDAAGKLNEDQSRFWRPKPAEELYDLQSDRDEVRNLARSAEHAGILAAMRKANEEHLRETCDLGFLPEQEFHARAADAGVSPYAMGHDAALYDFGKVFAAATLATARRDGSTAEILALLDQPDAGVRYWGTIGVLVQGAAAVGVGKERLVRALQDPSPMVRIGAAEALGRFGGEDVLERSLKVLVKAIDPAGDVFAALAAWNALDELDDRVRPVLPVLRETSAVPLHPPNERVAKYAQSVKAKLLADLGEAETKR